MRALAFLKKSLKFHSNVDPHLLVGGGFGPSKSALIPTTQPRETAHSQTGVGVGVGRGGVGRGRAGWGGVGGGVGWGGLLGDIVFAPVLPTPSLPPSLPPSHPLHPLGLVQIKG